MDKLCKNTENTKPCNNDKKCQCSTGPGPIEIRYSEEVKADAIEAQLRQRDAWLR